MSNALEIIEKKGLLASDKFKYSPRPLNKQFTGVEIYSLDDKVLFNLFFYIVDEETEEIYYGDFNLPDSVNLARIVRGFEVPVTPATVTV